eukprot:3007747-Pyramimonas_sp.AAC.2
MPQVSICVVNGEPKRRRFVDGSGEGAVPTGHLLEALDIVEGEVVRAGIKSGDRCDGRGLHEVRPLHAEVGLLPVVHGSSLFSRGDTQ